MQNRDWGCCASPRLQSGPCSCSACLALMMQLQSHSKALHPFSLPPTWLPEHSVARMLQPHLGLCTMVLACQARSLWTHSCKSSTYTLLRALPLLYRHRASSELLYICSSTSKMRAGCLPGFSSRDFPQAQMLKLHAHRPALGFANCHALCGSVGLKDS